MRRMLGFAAIAVMLAVSGCVPEPVLPTLPPTPTAAPVFASEEEALAAAEDAYAAYTELSHQIISDGGEDPERLEAVVTAEQFERELPTLEQFRTNGWRTSGPVTFDTVTLQSLVQDEAGAEVIVYLCLDASGARLLDAEGIDITPPARPDRAPFEVGFVADLEGPLLIASSEQWSGQDFC